jgi:transposase InsO family protein
MKDILDKEWLSEADLVQLRLKGLPRTQRGINKLIQREKWRDRPLAYRAGRLGWVYHEQLLPPEAQDDLYERRNIEMAKHARPVSNVSWETTGDPKLDKHFKLKAMRTKVLSAANSYCLDKRISRDRAYKEFAALYNERVLSFPDDVYDVVKHVSRATLWSWRKQLLKDPMRALGGWGRKKRLPDLALANGGEVAVFIGGLIMAQPGLSIPVIRDLTRAKFGAEVEVNGRRQALPSLRSFQRFVKWWTAKNAAAIAKETDPDRYKNKYRHAGGDRDRWVTAVNELWEIDATVMDVMASDGRRPNVYVALDVFSRRIITHVSRTPSTQAMLELLKKCIMRWGVPDTIRTDNGSDFISEEARRALDALRIKHDICTPFSPWRKGKVERAIGTIMHKWAPLMPGYVGHDVAERSKIEARKAFSERLGEKPAKLLRAAMSMEEIAEALDAWVLNSYERTVHGSLNMTPMEKAASCTRPVKRIESLKALEMLFAPTAPGGGTRVVTREGVHIGGRLYYTSKVLAGTRVLARRNPDDLGVVWLFDPDTQEFLAEAICPEAAGIDPEAAHAMVRKTTEEMVKDAASAAKRKAREITRNPRYLIDAANEQAAREAASVVAFPKRGETHEPQAVRAAAEATGERPAEEPPGQIDPEIYERQSRRLMAEWEAAQGKITQLHPANESRGDEDVLRYKRAKRLELRLADGGQISEADAQWLRGYQRTSEYRAAQRLEKQFPQLYELTGSE